MNARIGFRWSEDARNMTIATVRRLLPRIAATGAGWVLFPVSGIPLPEATAIARATRDAGLEPVIQVLPKEKALTLDTLRPVAAPWIDGGVQRIVLDDQPNRAERWSRWVAEGMPRQYARWIAPLLDAIAMYEGVTPVLAPLAPRGDYRGLTFLREALVELRRLQPAWLHRLAVACVNEQRGLSIAWGQGGVDLWGTEPRRGSEDDRGFYGWQWVQQIAGDVLERQVDVVAVKTNLTPTDTIERQTASVIAICQAAVTATATLVAAFPAMGESGWFNSEGHAIAPHLLDAMRTVSTPPASENQTVPRSIRVLHQDGRVETMELDAYLRGVVPAEIGAGSPVEALKAQAVAARCYAARTVRSPRHRSSDADICTTTHCQVWRSQTYPRTDDAVAATAAMVAYVDGKIIDAVYFACCDGATRNSEDVWRNTISYLRSVPCTLKNQEQYGHGVGMCQRGAIQMARQGASYLDILRHYYTGVAVEKGIPVDGMPSQPPLPVPPPVQPGIPPVPPAAAIRIERRTGMRAVAGVFRQPGIAVTVADPWGNQYRTLSGNKPEIGINGWEIMVPVDAIYRVTWGNKSMNVPVRGDFVVIHEIAS